MADPMDVKGLSDLINSAKTLNVVVSAISTSMTTMATAETSIAASQATIAALSQRFHTGTFTMTASATLVVPNINVLTTSLIFLQATNLAAGTLMGSAKSLAVTAKSAATSFTVSTANATNAVGTETLSYFIINP